MDYTGVMRVVEEVRDGLRRRKYGMSIREMNEERAKSNALVATGRYGPDARPMPLLTGRVVSEKQRSSEIRAIERKDAKRALIARSVARMM